MKTERARMMSSNKPLISLSRATIWLIALAVAFLPASAAYAGEGGASHYGPGFYGDFGVAVAPDPGLYLRNDLYYYNADASGERIVQYGELRADLEVDTAMYMLTGLMVLDKEVLGGRYAFGAILPIIYTDISADIILGPITSSVDADRTAVGDPGFIPASLFWHSGNFHINVSETITAPIGSYDKDRDVNAGLNYWSFDTTLAATYLHPDRGHEISAAIGHIYNTENDDTDYQTGQEFHLDYMLNQFLSETLAVGLHGFYYKQITGDSGSGALLGDFKGEAAGIGPAVMYATKIRDVDLVISAKWLHEFHAEHRLEGEHIFLNFTLAF
jgi:hypothetical protein